MNGRILVVALAVAAFAPAASLDAQSLTGTWSVSSETPRGAQTMTLVLEHDGAELTGTVAFSMGGRRGGGRGGQPLAIQSGRVEGNAFSFSITLSFNGNEVTQEFSGTFEGDTMDGTIQGGRGGGRPFRGERGG